MKAGVRAHDYGRHGVAEYAALLKNEGYEAVQLAIPKAFTGIGGYEDITEALCEEIRREFEAQKLGRNSLQHQLDELLANTSPDSPWIIYFQKFGQIDRLERDVLVRLVERILVYEDNRIEIVFQYQAQFEQAKAVAASVANDGELREAV